MFDELKDTIRHDVTHTIFRVTVVQQPPQPVRRMQERREDVTGTVAGGAVGAATATAGSATSTTTAGNGDVPQPVQRGPKIGRNDPCWCGSGKKYKRCHGA
jgi:preprotein translocase subunit SecA